MSNREAINRLSHGDQRVFVQQFPDRRSRGARELFTTVAVDLVLSTYPHGATDRERLRWVEAKADLLQFLEGEEIRVRREPKRGNRGDDSYLARLVPPDSEVWEVRSIDPRSHVRFIGRFLDFDCLVIFEWRYHWQLETEAQWREVMRLCVTQWEAHLPEPPLKGAHPHEFVSRPRLVP